MGDNLAALVSGLVDEAEDLDPEDGKDAGHQVENEAADQGEEEGAGEGSGGGLSVLRWLSVERRALGARSEVGGDLEAAEVGEPAGIGCDDAEELLGVRRTVGGKFEREDEAAVAVGLGSLRGVVGDEVVEREEMWIGGRGAGCGGRRDRERDGLGVTRGGNFPGRIGAREAGHGRADFFA